MIRVAVVGKGFARAVHLAGGALVALALLAPAAAFSQAKAKTHTVVIEGMRFAPAELTVGRGDTVVWINKDMFPHTASHEGGAFDSKSLGAGKSWRYKATAAGDFRYLCKLHPTMRGLLRVQ